jgi:hypothetical protein
MKKKRESYNFTKMGIPVGAVLKLKRDPNIEIEVVDDKNLVRYKNEVYTLTRMTIIILNRAVTRGTPYWTYNNEVLLKLWEKSLDKNYKTSNIKKENRWTTWNEVTLTKTSSEEVQRLKKESFERLSNFARNGNKEENKE